MNGNLVETLIGAVVLVVAGAFLYFAFSRADVGGVDGYTVIAKFDKVDGINVGSDVLLGGIKIGTVSDQKLDLKNYLAVLSLTLREEVKLPTDSSIKIASSGLLGENYLAIEPGADEEFLKNGDEIEHTQGAINLTDLIGKAIYSVGDTDKKK